MYRASLEGHRKSADNKCCNTLMLFIATLCNKARELRDGRGHKMSHFILVWCTRVWYSIEANMVTIHHNGWAEAETLMGGYNLSGLTCAPRQTSQWVTELPRPTVEGNWKESGSPLRAWGKWSEGDTGGREGGVMGAIVLRVMNVLVRWLGCGRRSPVWEVTSHQWYHAMTWANWQSCPKSLQEEEVKPAPNAEETDCKNIQDEGDWTLISDQRRRRNLPVPPEVPLTNGKLWRWKEEDVVNGSELEKVNHIKMVHSGSQVVSSAAQKRRTVLISGDSILRGTVAPICFPNNLSGEICCLLGAVRQELEEQNPSHCNTRAIPLIVIEEQVRDCLMGLNVY